MPAEHAPAPGKLSDGQQRVVAHARGPLLLRGVAGSGRTEALARRLGALASEGKPALALTCTQASTDSLRNRAEETATAGFEELFVHPHRHAAVRLLGEHAEEAGLDPFVESLSAAERLAMLLERVDELPLRRHEIRGNAAGLLARVVERIDALKAAGIGPRRFREWAEGLATGAGDEAERDSSEREREFADIYELHDAWLRDAGAMDGGGAVLALNRLLGERSALAATIAERFPHLIVDELEDACPAERALIALLAERAESVVLGCDDDQGQARCEAGAAWARETLHASEEVALESSLRYGGAVLDAGHAVLSGGEAASAPDRRADGPETRVSFWRSANERAEAQAVAREIESVLAQGEAPIERICVAIPPGAARERTIAAALEERRVPYRVLGEGAFFQRPEVRDVIAWLRLLADPTDAAAAVRALSRPPVELRSVDLARCTTIARRRKLDMVSALEASLESPQIPPEARDRIRAFLRLYGAAAKAMGELSAEVFVRRLIERVGFRRQRLFAAHPEAAERLRNLSRLSEVAANWSRRERGRSNRDFVRYLVAVSEAGVSPEEDPAPPAEAVRVMPLAALKGLEFDDVYVVGLQAEAVPGPVPKGAPDVPMALGGGGPSHSEQQRRLLYVAMTRARRALVLSRPEASEDGNVKASPYYEQARAVLGASEQSHGEELFGPAEGLHATYRMIQDEVLEEAWRAGGQLNEPRLDTALDVDRAVARFLELLKLAGLIQRPGAEPVADSLRDLNEVLGQAASDEQRRELSDSGLDGYLLDEEGESARRRELIKARDEPSLEAFLPKRGEGLALSATDITLYRTCPLKYKFGRVFGIPQEQTINQRFGIVIHQVLERYHSQQGGGEAPDSLGRLMSLYEAAWRRSGFGESDDELQYRERGTEALRRYHARESQRGASPRWVERKFDFQVGPHHLRGRVDRVDELPGGGYELIDYKTGDPRPQRELESDIQLAIYRLAAREAWRLDGAAGSYWYVLADEKVAVGGSSDDLERVEATVLEVGEGILGQDFEPRPSPEICSWCDFRLICPASEA
ncbi:MAG: ATP-dependent helicase [Actinobacteria bacterium]|nr:ATP-dependent helicase [Actinomycetota bacterium]